MEDDEWSLVQKIQRGICEQQSHGENVEAELEAERQARAEAKVNKPHKGLEEANIAHEGTLAALSEVQQHPGGDGRAEKDEANTERDLGETRAGLDDAMRERANVKRT